MTRPTSSDPSTWTTQQLGWAYVDLLHRGTLDPVEKAERAALQQEWSRRPSRERLDVLRRLREGGPQGVPALVATP